jgi:hypothetical protein
MNIAYVYSTKKINFKRKYLTRHNRARRDQTVRIYRRGMAAKEKKCGSRENSSNSTPV